MATITTGVYRHLKDRKRPICDKLKVVRLVWKSSKIFLQNKEQVLIDFLSGLILNKKRLKLSEEDVVSVWKTLSELFQSRKVTKSTKTQIIIKPSICQVINDSINLECDYQHHVVQCCLNLLKSPSLCHVYNKFDQLSVLLCNLLQQILRSSDHGGVTEDYWSLLQVVLPKYLQVQRSHPNQKMVLQTMTDKLLVSILTLWSNADSIPMPGLSDQLVQILHNSLFSKDHCSSYSIFIQSICPDTPDRTQPPKHIENIFLVMSQCIRCQAVQNNITPEKIKCAVHKFIPVYFQEFIKANKISDCSTVKDLLVYLCKLLGVNISLSKETDESKQEFSGQKDVFMVIGSLLKMIYEMDLYDKSHDPVLRQLVQILFITERSTGYFTCLVSLIQLNHLVVETKLENIIELCCSEEVPDKENLDDFLEELVKLYSKLRQMEKFLAKLVHVILSGKIRSKWLFTDRFLKRLGDEVELLPQGTAVEIWQSLVQTMDDSCISQLAHLTEDSQGIPKFEAFVKLLTLFLSHVKLMDYTITDINKRKVTEIMVTMATQLTKAVLTCTTSKEKKAKQNKVFDLVYPVMLLLHTWGEVHLLTCQYTQHADLMITEPLQHPNWISIVYSFITPEMAEKLFNCSLQTKMLTYLWELLLVQTLKSLWMTNRSKEQFVHHLTLPSYGTLSVSWNNKITDITEENYAIAKWKLLTDNFALYSNDLSDKQLDRFACFITDTVGNDTETQQYITLSSVTNAFLKSFACKEHQSLGTALISDVWRKLQDAANWKMPKKMTKNVSIRNVFSILGDKAWLLKDRGFIEKINLNDMIKKALAGSVNAIEFTDRFPIHLKKILEILPLTFMEPLDQIRCFVGLLLVCYHGSQDLKKDCLPLLTHLVESTSTVLKAVHLEVILNVVFCLYFYQNKQTFSTDTDLFISTCFKTVCKEGQLLERTENFIEKLKDEISLAVETIYRKQTITKQEQCAIQLTRLLIQQLLVALKRPYVREDILTLCKKYIATLSIPVFNLLYALRKVANQDPVISPVAQMYALLLEQSENLQKDGNKSQKNFQFAFDWSLKQLQCIQATDRMKPAIDFLHQSVRLKGNLELSLERRTAILDRGFDLLKQYSSRKLGYMNNKTTKSDEDKSTFDLKDDLLSLVSTVIVSCDISQFKELLYNLEQSVNVDLLLTDHAAATTSLNIWLHLLSSNMSEEQSTCFLQSMHNLTGYLTSLAQQTKDSSNSVAKLICDVQHKILLTCPVTKQMILTVLGAVILIPVSMETFPSLYEILNEVLLNHFNTVFDIIPVFLGCSKRLLFWLIQQGDQDLLSKTQDVESDLIGCGYMIDRLFTLISTHKEEFGKAVVYMVADYVDHVHQCTLLPTVKKALVSAIYKLLDISDKHVLAQLHMVLNQGVREVFKGLYSDYINFYKYSGRV